MAAAEGRGELGQRESGQGKSGQRELEQADTVGEKKYDDKNMVHTDAKDKCNDEKTMEEAKGEDGC